MKTTRVPSDTQMQLRCMSGPESVEYLLPCKCASVYWLACSWSVCVMRIYGECKQSGAGAVNIYTTEPHFFVYTGVYVQLREIQF